MKQLTREDVTIALSAEQDDTPVRGNAMVSGDDTFDREVEDGILRRLERGDIWAWATVAVTVSWESFSATTYLGCCCYDGEDDFREPVEYFDAMVDEALTDLNNTVQETWKQLKDLK